MRSLMPMVLAGALAVALPGSPGISTPAAAAQAPTEAPIEAQVLELSGAELHFADADAAAALLATEDSFARLQSPFDRQLRLASMDPVTTEDYLAFTAEQALDWTTTERDLIADAVGIIDHGLAAQDLVLPLPDRIDLVKSTGREEFGVCGYTRETFVVLTVRCLGGSGEADADQLAQLLAHELFHVMTRHDPSLRDALYAIIGFEPLDIPFRAPPEVADQRLTNPDAPVVGHAISLTIDGQASRFVPVLYSPRQYDGGSFFDYLAPKLLAITDDGSPGRTADGALDLRPFDVPGFFAQVGRNTDYIIHPEEILADNAALLILGRRDRLRSPWVVDAMAELLR